MTVIRACRPIAGRSASIIQPKRKSASAEWSSRRAFRRSVHGGRTLRSRLEARTSATSAVIRCGWNKICVQAIQRLKMNTTFVSQTESRNGILLSVLRVRTKVSKIPWCVLGEKQWRMSATGTKRTSRESWLYGPNRWRCLWSRSRGSTAWWSRQWIREKILKLPSMDGPES